MAGEPLFEMEFGTMADEDEGVIVSLPATEGEVKVVKVGEKVPPGGADDAVADLKTQFANMSQRVNVAERTAQEASQQTAEVTQRLARTEGDLISSQMDTVLSGIAAADAEAEAAMGEHVAASEAGDFPAQARAQRKMAGAEARKQRLIEAKDDLEDAVKRRPAPGTEPRPAASARRPAADPVEQVAQSLSAKSAAWIRSHPECVTDPKLNARMMAAHSLAIADDIALDSDEYFQRIEEGVKPAKPLGGKPAAPAGDGRRPSSAAAPASGAGGALNGGTEVRLTKGEAASATDGTLVWNYDDPSGQKRWQKGDVIGLSEMARRKHEGQKAGLYDKSYQE